MALALSRELTPVVTAIIVAGRVGSAFAAELGTMQVLGGPGFRGSGVRCGARHHLAFVGGSRGSGGQEAGIRVQGVGLRVRD